MSGFATRKLAASSKPKTTISEDGDLYTVTTVSAVGTTVRTLTDSFTLGQAFDKQLDDGRTVKATVTREGNRLVEVQTIDTVDGAVTATITRTFTDDGLEKTCEAGGIVSKRTHMRV
ncbi:lipocalin/fatty-acid binding family protein [Streptomyces sp. LN699]|uniref:lipocalin/fatty-acid binding family protein n=1 Tax=Streptomyces sp. LN699 TaxID=3112981 RepID=UPI0037191AB8